MFNTRLFKTVLMTLSALMIVLNTQAQEKLTSPSGLSVTVPAGWSHEVDDDDVLTITSPDENIGITFIDLPVDAVEAALEELENIVSQTVTDFHPEGEGEVITLNGRDGFAVSATAKYEGHDVELGILLLDNKNHILLVFGMGTPDAMEKYGQSLDAVITSIGR